MSFYNGYGNLERKPSYNEPESARNTQYPQQMYDRNPNPNNFFRSRTIQTESPLNLNSYNPNYSHINYYSNTAIYPNYNNNYNAQPQNQTPQSSSYENKTFYRANTLQIYNNNHYYNPEEKYEDGFDIYYFNNKDNYLKERFFFDQTLNIYKISDIIKNNMLNYYNMNMFLYHSQHLFELD